MLKLGPRKMLLFDACGATLTALLLAGILIPFQETFGMPVQVLKILSISAGIFAANSLTGFFMPVKYHRAFLKAMIFGNSLYCCATLLLMIVYFEKLTVLGCLYFVSEIMIILVLVVLESRCVNRYPGR